MAKKGKQPEPEEEPEPEPEPEESAEEQAEMAGAIVAEVADEIVRERVREEMARPLAVAGVLSEVMQVVSYRFTHHDEGSSVEEQQGETWTMEEEPGPAVLDTWARGSVPVKIRPKLKVEEIDDEQIPAAMSTGRSIRSVRSRGSRASGSRASRRSETGSEKEEKIVVAHSRPVPPRPTNRQEEAARQSWKELKDKEANVASIEAAYADERSRIAGVLEELKGTEYGYNHKGEIIMLESVNTERLPSQDVNLRVGLWSEADAEEPPPKGRKGRKGKGKKKQGRNTPAQHEQSGSITTAGALQGPVAETINMGVGALLRSGENEKRGPPRPKDPHRMSRKDYAQMLASMGGFEDTGLGDTTKTWDDAKPEDSDEDEDEEEEDVDWMEDARPATPDEEPEADIPVALKNHMEFNQSIVGASDWGMAGAPQAFRPTDPPDKTKVPVQRAMAVGERPRMPRERAYDKVPGIKTSEMKRLPAPVFPASKGHGFGAIGYLGGEKSFVEAAQEKSFMEAETTERSETGQSVELPPINGSQGSFASQNRSLSGAKRRSFNNTPPSHVHTLQPSLARKYLGVART
jgi:hypothetical protein